MPNAFIEPNREEIDYIMSRMPDTSELGSAIKEEFRKAMDYVLGAFDTNVRSVTQKIPGLDQGQHHYFAIRALNTPSTPAGQKSDVQLVGQEYFGINRFFPSLTDIADVEYWALYKGGGWELHTWNSHGEHLAADSRGTGELQTGYVKVNGAYLGPEDVISFMHTFKKRAEGSFARFNDPKTIEYVFSQIEKGQQPLERRLRQLQDLNLVDENGELTYIAYSRGTQQQATNRMVFDTILRHIREGNLKFLKFGQNIGPHGRTKEIADFYEKNDIEKLVKKTSPSYEDVQRFLRLEKKCLLKFGFSIRDMHLLKDWPDLKSYTSLDVPASNNTNQVRKNTISAFERIRRALGG